MKSRSAQSRTRKRYTGGSETTSQTPNPSRSVAAPTPTVHQERERPSDGRFIPHRATSGSHVVVGIVVFTDHFRLGVSIESSRRTMAQPWRSEEHTSELQSHH